MNRFGFSGLYAVGIVAVAAIMLSGFTYYALTEQPSVEIPADTTVLEGSDAQETNEPPESIATVAVNNVPTSTSKEAPPAPKSPTPTLTPTPSPAAKQPTAAATPKPKCISNPSPVFTHHITDISKVDYVAPPPTIGSGPSLKTHSYIGTDGVNVPVYAPAAMTLKDGSYYVGGPYTLDFQVSCEVTVRFAHMTNPVDPIKKLFPDEPQSDSRTHELSPVSFAAGDLIGYTTGTSAAGNWDFGVYNSSVTNRYANDPDWNNSTIYTTAVCPFDYFAPNLKTAYAVKFDSEILGGNPPHGESFCSYP